MAAVKYEDLSDAFDFVSSAAPMEHEAYISIDTGRIYWVSSAGTLEEELPDDFEESDRYLAIPHKNDLDLGRNLALRFAEAELPDAYERARDCFGHRGAYACFKALLAAHGCLERWYAFEAECTEEALKDWCKDNQIEVIPPVRSI